MGPRTLRLAEAGSAGLFPFALTLLLATILLPGCAGYRAGSLPAGPPAKVYLEPVQNEAYLSGFTPLYQREVRRLALLSPSIKLVPDPAGADLTAYTRLADFHERQVAFLENDSGQAISSHVSLSALLTITEPGALDPIIGDEILSVEAPVYSDPQTAFANPVDQTKPTLARNLAASVVLALELAGQSISPEK